MIFERSIANLPRAPDRVSSWFVPLWAHHFTLRLGVARFAWGLALAGKCYTNIHLGDETIFGSPGAGAGTYSSRVGVSRPYDISKTLEEFVLGKGKTRAYRSVKLLFLSPPALGGVLPIPIAGCG